MMNFDQEILLAKVLNVSRSVLRAYPERQLSQDEGQLWNELMEQREAGVPLAYLLGHKEFWSLEFEVTPDTLIPRPETEILVEKILEKLPKEDSKNIADLGTGCGAIALAIAKERPNWTLHATDISEGALAIARKNASRLGFSNVMFHQGSWLAALPKSIAFDAIISNPPYIAENDVHLNHHGLNFEPQLALVSGQDGLRDIRLILESADQYLSETGYLAIEHGYDQGRAVMELFQKTGYRAESYRDLSGLDRVVIGRKS